MPPRFLIPLVAAAVTLAGCDKAPPGPENAAAASDVKLATTSPPQGGTWADVVNETDGGYLMGNPDAKVKLVEIASLLCPFCKRFADEATAPLVDKYVKSGQVSWEFRPYLIHGPADMAANLIAECNGPKTFFPLVEAMYADQQQFEQRLRAISGDKAAQMQSLPPGQIFAAFAQEMGMPQWAAARGLPSARSAQCLADEAAMTREVGRTAAVSSAYPQFKGTPAFVLDGEMLGGDVAGWPALEAKIRDRLK